MKVIGLNASPKGKESRTLQLVSAVLDGAKADGAETELVDIYDLKIEYCTACGSCYAKGECILADDFSDLFERMMNADAIVLGSPNYIDSITAPLKAVFDRMADAIHCQMFTGKFACSVCTSGGPRYDQVVSYMNNALTSFGAIVIGGVGVATGRDLSAMGAAKEQASDLGKKLVRSIRGEYSYPKEEEYLKERRAYFCELVKHNKAEWRHEYDWWVEMGWIKEGS